MVSVQSNDRVGTMKKANNPAVFDTNRVTKYFIEMDGVRYPKDGIFTKFVETSCSDQYRDFELFSKEYVGEQL